MIFRAMTLFGAALAAGTLAANPLNVRWKTERTRPPEILTGTTDPGGWGLTNGCVFGLSAGGYRLQGRTHDRVGRDASGVEVYRFDEASVGAAVSEQVCDFAIGDYITNLPADPTNIDWVAMIANTNSAAVTNSYVQFIDAENPSNRVLVTRTGVFSLEWKLKDSETPVSRTYEVGLKVSEVPRRIFWTSKPFDAPVVQLPSGMGFRAVGDPKLFDPNGFLGDYGVYIDITNRIVGANARIKSDGTYDGPRGQFVLFYYDTPDCRHCLGYEVIEVCPPDPTYQTACVGEEVHPSCWEAVVADDMLAVLDTTEETVMGTVARAPYLLLQPASGAVKHKKAGKVYAISETEEGDLGAQKAAVYWQAKGPSGVFWPCERTCYHISWPTNCPVMVVGDGDPAPGCEIGLPDVYQSTLLNWRVPEGVVQGVSPSNTIRVLKPGHFTLRFDTKEMDDFFLMPITAVRHDDPRFERPIVPVDIGEEVVPAFGVKAGRNADLADEIALDWPGFIYEPGSPGLNWNPRLYRNSVASGLLVGLPTDGDVDPYAALGSAIYLVSPTPTNKFVEVWWKQECRVDGMEAGAILPVLPQRYHAVWPKDERVPELCVASQMGSDAPSRFCDKSEQALYFKGNPASAPVTFSQPVDIAPEGFSVAFGVNVAPTEADGHTVPPNATPCEFLALAFLHGEESGSAQTNGDLRLSFRASASAETPDVACFEIVSTLTCGRQVTRKTIACTAPTDAWTDFAVSVASTNGTAPVVYLGTTCLGTVTDVANGGDFDYRNLLITVGGNGYQRPSGMALGGLSVYGFPFDTGELANRGNTVDYDLYSWQLSDIAFGDFGDDEGVYVVDWQRGDAGYLEGCAVIDGEPVYRPSSLYAEDGVAPRIYYNNVSGTVGYCPNQQHAFVEPKDDRYVVWALRCDLCSGDERPYVLAEYPLLGRGAMQFYRVTFTNELYDMARLTVEAGCKVTTFRPLDLLQNGLSLETTAQSDSLEDDGCVTYRDRTGQLWARRDGEFKVFYRYPLEQGFFVPGAGDDQPPEGTPVNFMNLLPAVPGQTHNVPPTLDDLQTHPPYPVDGRAEWPRPEGLPVLKVGQVLTTATDGLPEVWNARSMGLTYPCGYSLTNNEENSSKLPVKFIDPTVKRTQSIPVKGDFVTDYKFTLGDSGTCLRRRGLYYFQGLPPSISDRFYVDVNAGTKGSVCMVLEGKRVENAAGTGYLLVNTLTAEERNAIKNLSNVNAWRDAADKLAQGDVEPSPVTGMNKTTVTIDYKAADHYALVTTGAALETNGYHYVTIVENDSKDASDLPVTMHTLIVTNELYTAPLVVLEDANNALSEQLTVYYAAGLGASATNYTFQWIKRDPPSDGSYPHDLPNVNVPPEWAAYSNGVGLVSINTPAGANTANVNPLELVNTYWSVRYKVNDKTAYGRWCDPTLAEGWLQRVLNRITPFSQRLADFYKNEAEVNYNMPAQIGAPYQGDVALNNENLSSVGLMQLYQTVFNRVESMSISSSPSNAPFSTALGKQLVETVARLADLNLTLAAEAYSDAKNPLIGSTDPTLPVSGALFSFANQVPTLLDEELALLRGRTAVVAPLVTKYPYYNRLFWNLTKGITQGEVAYVNNYNIAAKDGVLDAAAAAESYPQGHGDAYGYYLSAVKLYYRLLRNPNFAWGEPSMMEMLVNQNVVNMDYQEEDKLAEAAYNLAKTATDVLDLTARKQWRDTCGRTMESGYFDNPETKNGPFPQAFGYGEWAARGALGAFYNWATANSLLPDDPTNAVSYFADQSIKTVDRGTCASLRPLGAAVQTIERKLNSLDAGMNPLGLSSDTVPFDIDPSIFAGNGAVAGQSHYDQIRVRAVKALENCGTVLGYARAHGSRIRAIEDADTEDSLVAEETEASYNKQLVAIYGRPYSGDIGPGQTYDQGYVGPDIYHYNWMDLSQFGLDKIDTTHVTVTQQVWFVNVTNNASYVPSNYKDFTYTNTNNIPQNLTEKKIVVSFDISGEGIVKKPDHITGTRAAEGQLQTAYRDFLAAYVAWKTLVDSMNRAKKTLDWKLKSVELAYDRAFVDYNLSATAVAISGASTAIANLAQWIATWWSDSEYKVSFQGGGADNGSGIQRAFVTFYNSVKKKEFANFNALVSTEFSQQNMDDPWNALAAMISNANQDIIKVTNEIIDKEGKRATTVQNWVAFVVSLFTIAQDEVAAYHTLTTERQAAYETAIAAYNDFAASVVAMRDASEALQAKYEAYRTVLEEGEALQDELMTWRRRKASGAISQRYADMYERIARNTALANYSTAFDVAQRYVFELVKVYDYETGLLSSDREAGDDFLAKTVATRALGDSVLTVDSSQCDGGLWDVVNRMDANWEVLKGRLGINNPDKPEKWFSLRQECFGYQSTKQGLGDWKAALGKNENWSDDISNDERFRRYCQPLMVAGSGAEATAREMPGFIITFSTEISDGKNFFGKPLRAGNSQFSAADYSTKIAAVGVYFEGYDSSGLFAKEPNVYLVPIGTDRMYAPMGTDKRQVLGWNVVDQVLPLPYTIGTDEFDAPDWIVSFSGGAGIGSSAPIRRHSTMRMGYNFTSTRLVGRSVWNTKWMLVIPMSSLRSFSGDFERNKLRDDFINNVTDIKIGIKAYSRSGN